MEHSIKINRIPYSRFTILSLFISMTCIAFCGCGPMDPLMTQEIYEASMQNIPFTIQGQTVKVDLPRSKKKHEYFENPYFRIIAEDGTVCELRVHDYDPSKWELWIISQDKVPVRIPFRLIYQGAPGDWPANIATNSESQSKD